MTEEDNQEIWAELNDLRQQVEHLRIKRDRLFTVADELRGLHETLITDVNRMEKLITEVDRLAGNE